MVSASQLNGGLYAQGTVDGMSEELESPTLEDPDLSALEKAARLARWNNDKI